MKPISKFFINTLTGGIFFLLPLAVIVIILKKIHEILTKILKPVSNHLPDYMFGLEGHQIASVFVLIIFCFVAGLLFRSRYIRAVIEKLEDGFLSAIPGYSLIMTNVADKLHYEDDDTLVPVLVQLDESRVFGLLTAEGGDSCSVYVPGAPDFKSGNVHVFPAERVQKLDIPASAVSKNMRKLGKDSIELIKALPRSS
jgi:uncharacterized membrane protein